MAYRHNNEKKLSPFTTLKRYLRCCSLQKVTAFSCYLYLFWSRKESKAEFSFTASFFLSRKSAHNGESSKSQTRTNILFIFYLIFCFCKALHTFLFRCSLRNSVVFTCAVGLCAYAECVVFLWKIVQVRFCCSLTKNGAP